MSSIRSFCLAGDPRDFLLIFLNESFIVLHLHLRYNSFWVNFCVYRRFSLFFFAYSIAYSTASALLVEKSIISPLNWFCPFVKYQLSIFVWVYFWAFYSIDLCVYSSTNAAFFITCNYTPSPNIR